MAHLTISNSKILSFFKQRPEMDVETTLLKFIDIMETLQETMNKTLTNTTVLEILDNGNIVKQKPPASPQQKVRFSDTRRLQITKIKYNFYTKEHCYNRYDDGTFICNK